MKNLISRMQRNYCHSALFLQICCLACDFKSKLSGLQVIFLSPVAVLFIPQLLEYQTQSVTMFTAESRSMVVTNAVFMVLAVLSVVLRFQVRMPKALSLQLDDYMILTALVRMLHCIHMMPCSNLLFKVLRRGPCHHEYRRRFCCRLWNSVRVVE